MLFVASDEASFSTGSEFIADGGALLGPVPDANSQGEKMKDKNTPSNNPNELTTANSVLVLIDHQPWIGLLVHSIDPGLMINNVAGLAQAAKNLGVPTILTTIGAKGSVLVDPLFKELTEIFPDVTPIDRTSTHAWSHPEVRPRSMRRAARS